MFRRIIMRSGLQRYCNNVAFFTIPLHVHACPLLCDVEMADKVKEEESSSCEQGRRCRKCKAHGIVSNLKNHHRKKCQFKDCKCKTCSIVTRTRERSKIILQSKRQTIKEQKLQEQRNTRELPAGFYPHLHRGMPVASNHQSPQLLLSTTNQQSLSHITGFETYVKSITNLVAKILQETTSPELIPSNLHDVVARIFNPSRPISPPKASKPTSGPYLTTFSDNLTPTTMFPQPIPMNANEVRFGSNWAVGLPQRCSCPRCTSIMYLAIPNQEVTSTEQQ